MTPASLATGKRSARPFAATVWQAVPSFAIVSTGSLAWALLMAASALLAAWWSHGWATPEKLLAIGLLFAFGGALAFGPAAILANLLSFNRSREVAFAAVFLCLAVATFCMTALLFGLQLRVYFADSHGEPFGLDWALHFVFTLVAAFVQFAVLGLRLYLPFGLAALFAASLWHARYAR